MLGSGLEGATQMNEEEEVTYRKPACVMPCCTVLAPLFQTPSAGARHTLRIAAQTNPEKQRPQRAAHLLCVAEVPQALRTSFKMKVIRLAIQHAWTSSLEALRRQPFNSHGRANIGVITR